VQCKVALGNAEIGRSAAQFGEVHAQVHTSTPVHVCVPWF
jgi:hypothetical protein